MTATNFNLYSWDASASEVDAGLLSIDMNDEEGNELAIMSEDGSPLEVDMPNSVDASENAANMSNSTVNEDSGKSIYRGFKLNHSLVSNLKINIEGN